MLSYLPLAYMLERSFQVALYMVGGAIGFFSGSIKNLNEDFRILRPTVSPTVPRLVNRMYNQFMENISNSFFKKCVLRMALSSKKSQLER